MSGVEPYAEPRQALAFDPVPIGARTILPLRHATPCRICGTKLKLRQRALWERGRGITCLDCTPAEVIAKAGYPQDQRPPP